MPCPARVDVCTSGGQAVQAFLIRTGREEGFPSLDLTFSPLLSRPPSYIGQCFACGCLKSQFSLAYPPCFQTAKTFKKLSNWSIYFVFLEIF